MTSMNFGYEGVAPLKPRHSRPGGRAQPTDDLQIGKDHF